MLFVFNAPPQSGKDVACNVLKNQGWFKYEMKTPLHKITANLYQIPGNLWYQRYESRNCKNIPLKNLPWDRLNGISQRDALIYVAEKVIKPNFGKDYFAKIIAKEMQYHMHSGKDMCISDVGFKEEMQPLIKLHGEKNVTIIQLYRKNCNFKKDSRNYFKQEDFLNISFIKLNNYSTLSEFKQTIETLSK